MLKLILPQLIWFLNGINNNPGKLELDLLGDAILEIMEMFNGIVNGTHINVFLLDECSVDNRRLGQEYVYQYVKMLVLLAKEVKLYPKIEEVMLGSFVAMSKEILEYIFDGDGNVAEIYGHLVAKMMDLMVDYIMMQLNGNRLVEDRLLKVVEGVRLFNRYINLKAPIRHKLRVSNNLQNVNKLL